MELHSVGFVLRDIDIAWTSLYSPEPGDCFEFFFHVVFCFFDYVFDAGKLDSTGHVRLEVLDRPIE